MIAAHCTALWSTVEHARMPLKGVNTPLLQKLKCTWWEYRRHTLPSSTRQRTVRVVFEADAISAGRMWVTHFFLTAEPFSRLWRSCLPAHKPLTCFSHVLTLGDTAGLLGREVQTHNYEM